MQAGESSAATTEALIVMIVDDRKGSISTGKLADLVVLDRDLTAVDRDGIGETDQATLERGYTGSGRKRLTAP